jgi:hypothetical protein
MLKVFGRLIHDSIGGRGLFKADNRVVGNNTRYIILASPHAPYNTEERHPNAAPDNVIPSKQD